MNLNIFYQTFPKARKFPSLENPSLPMSGIQFTQLLPFQAPENGWLEVCISSLSEPGLCSEAFQMVVSGRVNTYEVYENRQVFSKYTRLPNHLRQASEAKAFRGSFSHSLTPNQTQDTVDGQNPAPPRMMIIPLFLGF